MTTKRFPLLEGNIYHVFTRSIAGFVIFRSNLDYERMRALLKYYQIVSSALRFSVFVELKNKEKLYQNDNSGKEELVGIETYTYEV